MKFIFRFVTLFLLGAHSYADVRGSSPADFGPEDSIETVLDQAFSHRDFSGLEAIKKFNGSQGNNLQPWAGMYDFDGPEKPGDSKSPWLEKNLKFQGQTIAELDITNPKHAKIFATIMQKYIYDGWFTQQNKNNFDDQFRENNYRTWCSTPWMVDGQKGREAVHGLTKEFPMHSNPVYEADGKNFVETNDKLQQPSSWGAAWFNKPVCNVYNKIFGTPGNPKKSPDFNIHQKGVDNPDGFVSFKMLFSVLKTWKDYPPMQGAYSWRGHVSDTHKATERTLQQMPHIQLDIALKDSRLKGTREDADNWVMLTYVFDGSFYNNDLDVEFLPESLRNMRPVGVQYGFESEHSIIFEGSKTNYMENGKFIPSGEGANLNGPADNPSSTCLGCHGASGLEGGIPDVLADKGEAYGKRHSFVWNFTFFNAEDFKNVVDSHGTGFQFNRQIDNAHRRVRAYFESQGQ